MQSRARPCSWSGITDGRTPPYTVIWGNLARMARWTLIAFGLSPCSTARQLDGIELGADFDRYLAVTQRTALSKMICIAPFLTTPVILSSVPRGTSVISRYLAAYVERMFSAAVAYRVPMILGSLGGDGKLLVSFVRYLAVTQRMRPS